MKYFAIALFAALIVSLPSSAETAKDLVGTWKFVVNETTRQDGSKVDTYGKEPKGIVMFSSLTEALRVDRFDSLAWRLAATAYGRKGEMGLSSWALAEHNILIGQPRLARALAERAMRQLKHGSPAWLRAQDIATQPLPRRGDR